MEIRFSMTPRLLALAAVFGLALLVLVFSIGFLIGQQLQASRSSNGSASGTPAPQANMPSAALPAATLPSATLPSATVPTLTPPQVNVPQPPSPPGVAR